MKTREEIQEKPEHTPGPWIADYRGVYRGVYTAKGTTDTGYGAMIADCPRAAGPYGALEASANADLIAAAPDLLAAAELALTELEGVERMAAQELGGPTGIVLAPIRAAIEKAKGQQQDDDGCPICDGTGWRPCNSHFGV